MYIKHHIQSTDYPDDLSEWPEAQKVYELISKHFKVRELNLSTGYKFDDGFLMEIKIERKLGAFFTGISVEYQNYTNLGGKHYCMKIIFSEHQNPFGGMYDSESAGYNLEEVFYSLLNGHEVWVERFAKAMVEEAKTLTEKIPQNKRGVKSKFHAREYI